MLCARLVFGGFAQLVSKSSCSKLGVHTRRDLMAIARKWPNSLEVVQGCFRGLSWDQSTGPPSMWLAEGNGAYKAWPERYTRRAETLA